MFFDKKYFFIATVVFLLGFIYYPLRIIGFDFSYLPGDLGDARFINYILEHGYKFLTGKINNFYDAPFFYPCENVLSYSDNLIGHLPIYSFYRILNFSKEQALQLWWLTIYLLNYFVSYFIFFRLSKNQPASIISAFLLTFSIVHLCQTNYLQINTFFMMPVIIYFSIKLLTEYNVKHLNFLILSLFLQLILSIYFYVFSVLVILILILIRIVIDKNIRKNFLHFLNDLKNKKTISIILSTTLLTVLYLIPYYKVTSTSKLRTYEELINVVPHWETYISGFRGTIWGHFYDGLNRFPENWYLHQYFPGIFCYIVLVFSFFLLFFKKKFQLKKEIFLLTMTLTVYVLLTTVWFNDFSPIRFLYKIKLFGPISFVSRVILMAFVINVFIILLTLTNFFQRIKFPFIYFIFLFPLVFIDNSFSMNKVVRVKKSEVVTRYIPLQKEINKNKKQYKLCALISENQSKSFVPNILDAMLFSQQNDLACINGYSSSSPLYADAFWRFHNRKELLSWINLKKINVNDVFVYNVDKQKAIKITALDEYLTRIQNMVEYIKTQSVWMDDIKKRAIQRNITTDSCLVAEAVWQIEYNSKD